LLLQGDRADAELYARALVGQALARRALCADRARAAWSERQSMWRFRALPAGAGAPRSADLSQPRHLYDDAGRQALGRQPGPVSGLHPLLPASAPDQPRAHRYLLE